MDNRDLVSTETGWMFQTIKLVGSKCPLFLHGECMLSSHVRDGDLPLSIFLCRERCNFKPSIVLMNFP